MNPAKLRRSRDVLELERSKIENGFRIRDLAMFNMAFCIGSHQKELARQATDPIVELLICHQPRRTGRPYISSGRHSTASLARGLSTL